MANRVYGQVFGGGERKRGMIQKLLGEPLFLLIMFSNIEEREDFSSSPKAKKKEKKEE